jgi:hypothetical protein
MSPKVFLATALFTLVAVSAQSELEIQVRGSSVDIRARRVPLQQVLDALSQKTGMKIVYDTEPPQEIVTFDLSNLSVNRALMEVLQGHGLTYAVSMDPSGLKVDTLLLTHGGAGGLKAPSAPPPMPEQEQQQEFYEEPEPPEPPSSEATPVPSPTSAGYWTPAPVVFPGMAGPGGQQPPPSQAPPPPDGAPSSMDPNQPQHGQPGQPQ